MPDDVRPASWQDLISAEAEKQGVDPRLALAVAHTESSFNPAAISPAGAVGLMQLMPATGQRRGVDINDPIQNIRGGVGELKDLLAQNKGDVVMALRRYNASPRADPTVTQPYVDRVLKTLQSGVAGGTVAGTPPPTPPPPGTPASPAPTEKPWYQTVAEGLDPRTPEGRRNLAGGVGAAGGTILTGGMGPVAVGTAAVLGSMIGGGVVQGGEAAIGGPPPGSSVAAEFGKGATEQGLYQMLGHAFVWPFQAVGRRVMAGPVGRNAAAYLTEKGAQLSASKAALLDQLNSALDASKTLLRGTQRTAGDQTVAARATARRGVAAGAQMAREGVQAAQDVTSRNVDVAGQQAEEGVTSAQQAAETGNQAAVQPYDQIVGQPPPDAAAAGTAANQVITEGGAATARDQLGRAVEQSAKTGPDVDITALKARAQSILERELKPPAEAFPRTAPESAEETAARAAEATGLSPEMLADIQKNASLNRPHASGADALAAINAAMAAAGGPAETVIKHPAMQVLQRIANASDTVPFAAAHQFKRDLDEAVGSGYDRIVKTRVKAITKGLRGELRQAMSGHAPYDQATAAYAQIAPLYEKGIAPRLRKLATEEPEAVVRLINPKQPTRLVMLHDLLTNQAAAGGDAAGGQAAWDSVRSAWTFQKVIQGGVEKLGDRLDAVEANAAFHKVMFGDASGQQVWTNLRTIDAAVRAADAAGTAGVQAAKASGKAGVEAATDLGAQRVGATRETGRETIQSLRDLGERSVEHTRQAGAQQVEQAQGGVQAAQRDLRQGTQQAATAQKTLTAEQRSLAASTLTRQQNVGPDALRAVVLGPGSIWGGISIFRLLHGPTGEDLIKWAAFSPAHTKLFVRAVTSSLPAQAVANLARGAGIMEGVSDTLIGGKPPTPKPGAPPPAPAQPVRSAAVGAPPPMP